MAPTTPATVAGTGTEPAFLGRWPQSWPRLKGDWTVRGPDGWGLLQPEAGTVRLVDPAADDRLPGITAAVAGGGRLLSYRAGRRAVVADPNGTYVKVVRRSRAGRLAELHPAIDAAIGRCGASSRQGGDGLRVPAVVDSRRDGRVTLSAVPGMPLHELLLFHGVDRVHGVTGVDGVDGVYVAAGVDGVDAVLERVAVALTRFHAITFPGPLETRRPDHPEQWLGIVGRAEPDAVAGLSDLAATLPPVPTGGSDVVHGDLHDKNLLIDDDAIGLIDLDGVALGAAEDDLANLAVHLEFRALQAGFPDSLGRHWADTLLTAAAGAANQTGRTLSVDRVHATTRHTWFRLACMYRFRASGRHLVPALTQRALG